MKQFKIDVPDDLAEMLEDLSENTTLPISNIVTLCCIRRITLNSPVFDKYKALARKQKQMELVLDSSKEYINSFPDYPNAIENKLGEFNNLPF